MKRSISILTISVVISSVLQDWLLALHSFVSSSRLAAGFVSSSRLAAGAACTLSSILQGWLLAALLHSPVGHLTDTDSLRRPTGGSAVPRVTSDLGGRWRGKVQHVTHTTSLDSVRPVGPAVLIRLTAADRGGRLRLGLRLSGPRTLELFFY